MSVQSKLKQEEIEQRRAAASADIAQREKESLRGFIPKFPLSKISINDPSWYKKFQPVDTVISLPNFVSKTVPVKDTILGTTKREFGVATAEMDALKSKLPLPSVLIHHYLPHIGKLCDNDSFFIAESDAIAINTDPNNYPINTAMLRDLMQLGKFNSRTVVPDPSIMGFYIIATTDLYALAVKLRTALSVALHFESTDVSIPKHIINGLGFIYSEFIGHIKEWRAVYQELVCLINSALPIPTNLTYFSRRVWLASTIVKSTESSLSPIQLFDQVAYGKINSDATAIEYSDWELRGSNNHPQTTYVKFRAWFKEAVNALLLNEEICTFISNLRAGIPAEKFYLQDVEIPTMISIPMLDEVRLIIQNMIVLAAFKTNVYQRDLDLTNWNVTHDIDGNLLQPGQIYSGSEYMSKIQHSFNSFRVLENDHYLVASRLKCSTFDSTDNKQFMRNCGTEVMVGSELCLSGYDNTVILATDLHALVPYAEIINWVKGLVSNYTQASDTYAGDDFVDMFNVTVNGLLINPMVDALVDSYVKCIDGMFNVRKMYTYRDQMNEITYDFYWVFNSQEVDYFVPVSVTELNFINEVCLKSLYYLSDDDFKSNF